MKRKRQQSSMPWIQSGKKNWNLRLDLRSRWTVMSRYFWKACPSSSFGCRANIIGGWGPKFCLRAWIRPHAETRTHSVLAVIFFYLSLSRIGCRALMYSSLNRSRHDKKQCYLYCLHCWRGGRCRRLLYPRVSSLVEIPIPQKALETNWNRWLLSLFLSYNSAHWNLSFLQKSGGIYV